MQSRSLVALAKALANARICPLYYIVVYIPAAACVPSTEGCPTYAAFEIDDGVKRIRAASSSSSSRIDGGRGRPWWAIDGSVLACLLGVLAVRTVDCEGVDGWMGEEERGEDPAGAE